MMMTTGGENQRRKYEANLASGDPYEVLGLEAGAAPRAVKKAYFSLVRDYPPEERPQQFKIIRAAYEQLRDPAQKAKTDLFRVRPPEAWQPRKRRGKLQLDFDTQDVFHLLSAQGDLGQRDFRQDFRPIKL
jgi:curved DNA-binding protein CbpA